MSAKENVHGGVRASGVPDEVGSNPYLDEEVAQKLQVVHVIHWALQTHHKLAGLFGIRITKLTHAKLGSTCEMHGCDTHHAPATVPVLHRHTNFN